MNLPHRSNPAASGLRRAALPALLAAAAIGAPAASAAPLQVTQRYDGARTFTPIADVNGDGRVDFAANVATGGVLRVAYGTARVEPDIATAQALGTGVGSGGGFELRSSTATPPELVGPAGDFDADGIEDFLVAVGDTKYLVYGSPSSTPITLGVANARVTAMPGAAGGPTPMGDFNGDGYDDLLMSRGPGASVMNGVIAGSGAIVIKGGPRVASLALQGTVRLVAISGLQVCTGYLFLRSCHYEIVKPVALGDINGDGKSDLFFEAREFIALGRTSTATIPGTGPDAYGIKVTPSALRDPILSLAGDVTGDGINDIVVAGSLGLKIVPGRVIAPGGTLDLSAPAFTVEGGSDPRGGLGGVGVPRPAGDQNGDGRSDLIDLGYGAAHVFPVPSSAPGTITETAFPALAGIPALEVDYAGYVSPTAPQLVTPPADLDGDGQPDLILDASWADAPGVPDAGGFFVATHGDDHAAPQLQLQGLTNSDESDSASSVTPARFAAGAAPAGTTLRITLTETASVELTYRRASGAVLATEVRTGLPAGVTSIPWDGQGHGVSGAAGDYVLDLVPFDAAGNRGAKQSLPFTIVGGGVTPKATLTVTQRTEIPAGLLPPQSPSQQGRYIGGTCPAALGASPADGETLAVDLGTAVEGDLCTLQHQAPDANIYGPPLPSLATWPWRAVVSVNGGPEVDITAITGGGEAIPPFRLRAGANTVVVTDRWDARGQADLWSVGTAANWAGPTTLNGAKVLGSAAGLQLTLPLANQRGALYATKGIADANRLDVSFDATIDQGQGTGNGLALVFTDVDAGNGGTAMGGANVGLGFVGTRGVAIGLVTVKGTYNPAENFVGITTGTPGPSGYPAWLQTADPGKQLGFATTHVRVVAKAGVVVVSLDGVERLRRTMTLPRRALIGFTAATGGASRAQRHLVKNVSVRTS